MDQSGKPSAGTCPALSVDPNCPFKTGKKPTTYYSQFYKPYQFYPAPIFAIPGNHDGITYDETMETLAAEGIEAVVVGVANAGERRASEYSPCV